MLKPSARRSTMRRTRSRAKWRTGCAESALRDQSRSARGGGVMGQGDEPEFYREQPDRPPAVSEDIGIHSSPIGSFMPIGIYRPLPIVRFAGAVIVQALALLLLFGVLYSKAGMFTVATTAL